jgi:peptide-methionine (S)-S-oxide reductase
MKTMRGFLNAFGLRLVVFLAAAMAFVCAPAAPIMAKEAAVVAPAPKNDPPPRSEGMQTIVLAGGCFWGVQGVFQHVVGVSEAVSGYAGGSESTAHYEDVSSGRTGHAESVKIAYDPKIVSLGQLLRIYFSVAHDPTQLNAQGPDQGTQYRSAIFYSDNAQEKAARDYIAQLDEAHIFPRPIVTALEPLSKFYAAENYHQDYLIRHPRQPYIVINDLPKIENLKRLFPSLYRAQPKLVSG